MMKRLLIFGLGTSLIQVIIFYLFISIVYWFAAAIMVTYPEDNEPEADYVMLFSAVIFPVMVLSQNLLAAVINNIKATYVLMAIAITVYIVGLINIGDSVTFKSGLCLFFGLIVLSAKTKIDNRLR